MPTSDLTGSRWRKSSRSNGSGACVEVGVASSTAGVRSSKLGSTSPILPFTTQAWSAFLTDLKTGRWDR